MSDLAQEAMTLASQCAEDIEKYRSRLRKMQERATELYLQLDEALDRH